MIMVDVILIIEYCTMIECMANTYWNYKASITFCLIGTILIQGVEKYTP